MSGVITIPFHIGDFLSGTLHMDTLEKGAYVMLLLAHYQIGAEGIPNDDLKLARIAGVSPTVWKRIKDTVLAKFESCGENIISKKVQKVLRDVEEKSLAQRAKALKKHAPTHAAAEPQHSQPKPKPKPLDDDDRGAAFVEVGKGVAKIVGWDKNPSWFGNYAHCEVWLKSGFDPEQDIYPTVERIMSKWTGPPPGTMSYFDKPIAQAYANRTREIEIPEGRKNARKSAREIAAEWAAKQNGGDSGGG